MSVHPDTFFFSLVFSKEVSQGLKFQPRVRLGFLGGWLVGCDFFVVVILKASP